MSNFHLRLLHTHEKCGDKYFPHCRQKLKLTILNDNIIIHFITMDPQPRLSSLPLLKFILQSR